jgi:Tripartite tricarboxylate transporter family receptor
MPVSKLQAVERQLKRLREIQPFIRTTAQASIGLRGRRTSRPWEGVGAPRNTPVEIIDKLNKATNAGLADPRVNARITDLGYTVFASSPADFGRFIAAFTEKWAEVIKFAGAKIY